MPDASTPRRRVGRTPQGRRQMRSALAVAALDLFAAHGFEATTVDQIAERAGVGRRTFFRYFRSKEDVLFPDHEERLVEVERILESAPVGHPPLLVVSDAAELVLEMYLAEPEVSSRRFDVTRQVPSLRDKEIVTIDRYERVFARHLQRAYEGCTDGSLRASIAASSVVAAHNHVLREWLKTGGIFDARAMLRHALRSVRAAMAASWGDEAGGAERVIVSVVRTEASAEEVASSVAATLREL